MFKPKYKITAKLLGNLNEIERLYGRLEGIKAPQNLLLNLEKTNLIKSSFASNSIEGNPLSYQEVTNLILNDRIPVNRDEKEIKNYFAILKILDKKVNETINLKLILDIHRELFQGIDYSIAGKVRNEPVVVGSRVGQQIIIKHNPPFHKKLEIEKNLIELTEWLNEAKELPILKIAIFHHRFVFIHPFVDGNGRVCRILSALLFLKQNYLINKYFILDDYYYVDRNLYSNKLHSADSGDLTEWMEYFTDGIKHSLQSSLGKIEVGLEQLRFDIRPTNREKDAIKIIQKYRQVKSSDLVRELKITRQQAFNLLNALIRKGYLLKKGSTKNSYYILK